MLSFWIMLPRRRHHAGRLLRARAAHAAAGWTAYPPLSARAGVHRRQLGPDPLAARLFVLGVSSMMGSINYITTIINMRAPGHDAVPACR